MADANIFIAYRGFRRSVINDKNERGLSRARFCREFYLGSVNQNVVYGISECAEKLLYIWQNP